MRVTAGQGIWIVALTVLVPLHDHSSIFGWLSETWWWDVTGSANCNNSVDHTGTALPIPASAMFIREDVNDTWLPCFDPTAMKTYTKVTSGGDSRAITAKVVLRTQWEA